MKMVDEVRCEWCGLLLRYGGKDAGNGGAIFASDRPLLIDVKTRKRHSDNGLIWAACVEHVDGLLNT